MLVASGVICDEYTLCEMEKKSLVWMYTGGRQGDGVRYWQLESKW